MRHHSVLHRTLVISLALAFAVLTSHHAVTYGQIKRIPGRAVTEDDLFRWVNEYSNWGRWGRDDGQGQANFINPAKRVQAANVVKYGVSVSMARNVALATDPGVTGTVLNRTMVRIGPNDSADQFAYTGTYHGTNHTHWDALCHFHPPVLNGRFYNGNSVATDIDQNLGCRQADILAHKDGVVTRGVIFDATKYFNVEYLEPSTPIHWEDLENMERRQGVRVHRGDAIFLYTGRWKRQAAGGGTGNAAGYHPSVIQFLYDRGVAFIGGEQAQDVQPSPFPRFAALPVHTLAIGVLGVGIFDTLDLDQVVETARRLDRYEFMFTAAPLRVPGATGGPINPIATF